MLQNRLSEGLFQSGPGRHFPQEPANPILAVRRPSWHPFFLDCNRQLAACESARLSIGKYLNAKDYLQVFDSAIQFIARTTVYMTLAKGVILKASSSSVTELYVGIEIRIVWE